MSDVVDRILDHDRSEAARKKRVADKCKVIFDSLYKALEGRVSKYNEENQQQFGPPAVSIGHTFTSNDRSLTIKKHTQPPSSLTMKFPNNDGEMQFQLSAKTGKSTLDIKLDIVNDVPTYYYGNTGHSTDSLADLVLLPILSSTGFSESRRIGF